MPTNEHEARTEKERIYDEQISPLMTSIIAICKAHDINMATCFGLGFDVAADQPLYCTTVLPIDEGSPDYERICEVGWATQYHAETLAVTVFGAPDAN